MLQFLYVVLPKQSFGSSTSQGDRASVERPFAAGHLHDAVSLGKERWFQKTDVSFCLFHVTLDEGRLRPPSQHGRNLFRAKDMPKSCRILTIDTSRSNGTNVRKSLENSHASIAHLP
jgi:hypothetical protein